MVSNKRIEVGNKKENTFRPIKSKVVKKQEKNDQLTVLVNVTYTVVNLN